MTDKQGPADPALRGYEASVQDYTEAHLHLWVSACLGDGVQELDTMIVTAPDSLRSQFRCYDVMADEIEIVVQRIWRDIARMRMRRGH
ncbi:hypothetical protein GCM10011402_37550 [Paracoccus acridae]|uniref:Uncharacterized protein n=1 Tax=Paracoccus acridae TaxID=1795310 RepID=A0ABQ1VMP9_9RHOB|nr:hypothetical protein [Paracoccus acridae]GGF81397.1 hypothetical protein GCM10011402_37550 [Paracoccus acridae]